MTVIEIALGDGAYLHNPVTEIAVAAGATLTHIRLQDEGAAAFHLAPSTPTCSTPGSTTRSP